MKRPWPTGAVAPWGNLSDLEMQKRRGEAAEGRNKEGKDKK